MNSTAPRQLFTVEEATQRLPLVTSIVKDIVDLYEDVMDRRDRLDRLVLFVTGPVDLAHVPERDERFTQMPYSTRASWTMNIRSRPSTMP